MSTLHILEFNVSGHRLFYVSRLLEESRRAGMPVKVWLSTGAAETEEYGTHLGDALEEEEIVESATAEASCWERVTALRLIAQEMRRNDVLLIPDGDVWLLPALAGRLMGMRISMLLLRTENSNSISSFLRSAIKCSLAVLLHMAGVRVTRLVPAFPAGTGLTCSWFRWLPEVQDLVPTVTPRSKSCSRALLGIKQQAVVALIAGHIDERKSPRYALQWLQETSYGNDAVLLLAGAHSQEVRDYISRRTASSSGWPGQLKRLDRYLTDDELAISYSAADVVLVLHENQGPSGALAHAFAYRRPVLAWGSCAVTSVVSRWNLGLVLDDRSAQELDRGILALMEKSYQPLAGADAGSDSFLASLVGDARLSPPRVRPDVA